MSATWFFILSLIASAIMGLIALVIRDFKYYRDIARREFCEYIYKYCTDIVLEKVGPKTIKAKYNSQLKTLRTQVIYLALSKIDLKNSVEKDKAFKRIADEIRS